MHASTASAIQLVPALYNTKSSKHIYTSYLLLDLQIYRHMCDFVRKQLHCTHLVQLYNEHPIIERPSFASSVLGKQFLQSEGAFCHLRAR